MLLSELPSHFTYRSETDGNRYTRNPVGSFHLDRLVQGLPAYKMPCIVEGEINPAVLVLADPLLAQYSYEDFRKVIHQLCLLEDEDFQFYYHTGHSIERFSPNQIENIYHPVIQALAPIEPSQIHEAMAPLGYKPKEILILDSDTLHHAPFSDHYQLLNHLQQSPWGLESFINHFNARHFPKSLGISLKTEEDIRYWQALSQRLPNIRFKVRIESLACYQQVSTTPSLQTAIQTLHLHFKETPGLSGDCWTRLDNLDSLHISTKTAWTERLPHQLLQQVKCVEISSTTFFTSQIEQLLAALTSVEELTVGSVRVLANSEAETIDERFDAYLNPTVNLTANSLANLKTLRIQQGCASAIQDSILKTCQKLEKLTCHCSNLKAETLANASFRQLTEMTLTNPSLEVVSALLTQASLLTSLAITGIPFTKNTTSLLLEENSLPQLRALNLHNTPKQTCAALIKASPNLRRVVLNRCHEEPTICLSHPNLRQVKHLELNYTSIKGQELNNILTITQQLTSLQLYNCHHLRHISPVSLPKLKKLRLDTVSLIASDLFCLLQPQLKKLYIENCHDIKLDHHYQLPSLALETLELFDLKISSNNLLALLHPSLTVLTLDNLTGIKDLNLDQKNFSILTSCKLSHLDIRVEAALQVFAKTPNLQHLSIASCPFLESKIFYFNSSSLQRLHTFYVDGEAFHEGDEDSEEEYSHAEKSNMAFSAKLLASLFNHAPVLKHLSFNNCRIEQNLKLTPANLAQLQLLELGSISVGSWLSNLLTRISASLLELSINGYVDCKDNLALDDITFITLQWLNIQGKDPFVLQLQQAILQQAPQLNSQNRSQNLKQINACLPSKITPSFSPPEDGARSEAKAASIDEDAVSLASEPEYERQDLSTALDDTEVMPAQVYFKPWSKQTPDIEPNYYRLTVYEKAVMEDEQLYFVRAKSTFIEKELPPANADIEFKDGWCYHQAQLSLLLTSPEQKFFLPSLQAKEQLVFLRTEPADVRLKLLYCPEDDLYAVQAHQAVSLSITFGVAFPSLTKQPIAELDSLVEQYQTREATRRLQGTNATDILNEIISHGVGGACRFLSAAFYQQFVALQLPTNIQVRLLGNDLHSFIELSNDNGSTWHARDLGGIPANVVYHNPWDTPEDALKTLQALPTPAPAETVAPDVYCQTVMASSTLRNLLIFSDPQAILAFQAYFQAYFHNHPTDSVLYIDSPDTLALSPQRLQLTSAIDGAPVDQQLTPANALLDQIDNLLSTYPAKKIHLLINWSQFNPTQTTQFNSMLDAKRRLYHVEFSDRVLMYSLVIPQQVSDASMRSRHAFISTSPCSIEALQQGVQHYYPNPAATPQAEPYYIALYHSSDWEALVYGSLKLEDQGVCFRHGKLLQAWHNQASQVCFVNAPWHLESFQVFWQKLSRDKTITLYGQSFSFNSNLQLSQQNGYPALERTVSACNWSLDLPPADAYPLNPSSFDACFGGCTVEQDRLLTLPGWLADAQHRSIAFYVTRALSLDQWMQLLDKAQTLGVKAHFYLAPQVQLPPEMHQIAQPSKTRQAAQLTQPPQTSLVIATDPFAAASQIKNDYHRTALLVAVTDRECYDWFQAITDIQLTTHGATAKRTDYALWTALKEGRTVILHGEFSKEQGDALASFFLPQACYFFGQERLNFAGCLICVSTSDTHLHFVPMTHRSLWNPQAHLPSPQAFAHTEPTHIPRGLNASNIEGFTVGLENHRAHTIVQALSSHPYVWIDGPSSSGKSHFFSQDHTLSLLKRCYPSCSVHHDFTSLIAWATDTTLGVKLLILDDIQHSLFNFSILLDALQTSPSLFFEGREYPLTANHKFILLGQLPSSQSSPITKLLELDSARITWQALPGWYLLRRIVWPLLANSSYADKSIVAVGKVFIKKHQQLNMPLQALKTLTLLLLQSLSTLKLDETDQLLEKNRDLIEWEPEFNRELAALPSEAKSLPDTAAGWGDIYQDWLHTRENSNKQLPALAVHIDAALKLMERHHTPSINLRTHQSSDFSLTPSRYLAYHWMEQLLAIRHLKQIVPNPVFEGHWNAVLLEGHAGIGKTELVHYFIERNGLVPGDVNAPDLRSHIYYELSPASTDIDRSLLKAFHEGALVIIHEANSAKIDPRLLKSLLNGVTLDKHKAQRPGFMVLLDQNPISYQGRRQFSADTMANIAFINLPEYPNEELHVILSQRFPILSSPQRTELIDIYNREREAASQNPTAAAPTFRDLLRRAQNAALAPPSRGEKRSLSTITADYPVSSRDMNQVRNRPCLR